MDAIEHYYDPRTRYRVYRVTKGAKQPEEIAGCEHYDGIGLMLVTLDTDGEFGPHDAIGIMDTGPRIDGDAGIWIISPYAGR